MRQSIVTKYHGPTDKKGSRVSATSASGHRIIFDWDDSLNIDENHAVAARRLAAKLGWAGDWFGGSLFYGCVFVCADGRDFSVERQAA